MAKSACSKWFRLPAMVRQLLMYPGPMLNLDRVWALRCLSFPYAFYPLYAAASRQWIQQGWGMTMPSPMGRTDHQWYVSNLSRVCGVPSFVPDLNVNSKGWWHDVPWPSMTHFQRKIICGYARKIWPQQWRESMTRNILPFFVDCFPLNVGDNLVGPPEFLRGVGNPTNTD